MATLPVEIICFAHKARKSLHEAVLLLNAHQDAYKFTFLKLSKAGFFKGSSSALLTTAELFEYLQVQRSALRGYHPHLVAFVERKLMGSKWGNLFWIMRRWLPALPDMEKGERSLFSSTRREKGTVKKGDIGSTTPS